MGMLRRRFPAYAGWATWVEFTYGRAAVSVPNGAAEAHVPRYRRPALRQPVTSLRRVLWFIRCEGLYEPSSLKGVNHDQIPMGATPREALTASLRRARFGAIRRQVDTLRLPCPLQYWPPSLLKRL
jgi:hypothetical protein